MKKTLIIMCAALFVAATVLPALAVDMSMSGFYRVRGIYQSNAEGGSITPYDNSGSSNAWWDHMLQIDPVFKVSDNLKLVTRVSMFNNQMFGNGNTSGGVNAGGGINFKSFGNAADNILFNQAYIDWNTSVGKVKVGRMSGYDNHFLAWANTTLDADRVMYCSPTSGGFNFEVYTEKQAEVDALAVGASDRDLNRYGALLQYAKPGLFVGYALDYYRDRTNSAPPSVGFTADYFTHTLCLKASGSMLFFEGEAQIQHGDVADYYGATADVSRSGFGAYGNLGVKTAGVTAGVGVAYTSGDDNGTDDDFEVGPGSGLDFQPLYIIYGPLSNVLNTTLTNPAAWAGPSNGGNSATGSLAYWVYADYSVDPKLTLHAALGYAQADTTNSTVYEDDSIGTEVDLGLKYQIMNNLAYELHGAYMLTGDLYKGPAGSGLETDDVYQIDHSLTLSF